MGIQYNSNATVRSASRQISLKTSNKRRGNTSKVSNSSLADLLTRENKRFLTSLGFKVLQ